MIQELPTELLDQITTYLPSAQSIAHLSQTSHALHNFVEKQGWRSFSQARFPSLVRDVQSLPTEYRHVARSLTTLSKNCDRRGFLATFLEPREDVRSLPDGKQLRQWKRPRGQTMGFQPAIDVREDLCQGKKGGKREVLAWSAGAELLVRERGKRIESERGCVEARLDLDREIDQEIWWSYKPVGSVEGRDDITSVNILNLGGAIEGAAGHQMIISTANGDLQLLDTSESASDNTVRTLFETRGLPVRSTTITNSLEHRLLAANLSDCEVALYPIDETQDHVSTISNVNALPQAKRGCRIWSTTFLDATRLAIGLGPSVEPIHIFAVQPSGLSKEPIRKFTLVNLSIDDRLDSLGTLKTSSAVYPIHPLDTSSQPGTVFLSGGYDGTIRLHDMRSHDSVSATYSDPTDDSAIYSLLPRGLDRVVAGTSRHSLLKIFDLRMQGASDYSYLHALSNSFPDLSTLSINHHGEDGDMTTASATTGDWNVFIRGHPGASHRGPNAWMRRSAESSIYSLASSSAASPVIYAGVENAVVEFNFTGVLDKFPDPGLWSVNKEHDIRGPSTVNSQQDGQRGQNGHRGQNGRRGRGRGGQNGPPRDEAVDADVHQVLNLAMYSQGTSAKDALKLRVQRGVGESMAMGQRRVGLDERWVSNTSQR